MRQSESVPTRNYHFSPAEPDWPNKLAATFIFSKMQYIVEVDDAEEITWERNIGEGLGWAIFGGLITAITYSVADDGGTYVIAGGAMIVGGIQLAIGVLQLWFTADFKPGTRFKLLGAMSGVGGAAFCVFVGITKNIHIAGIILTATVALAFGWSLFLVGRHQKVIVGFIIHEFRETLLWVIDLKTRSKILLFVVAPLTLFTVIAWS